VVLVENGNYQGFGFFDQQEAIHSIESARSFIKSGKENRVVQNLVSAYLANPRGVELVILN
jgi:hypothetical protein